MINKTDAQHINAMTDKEMLMLAYGAMSASTNENLDLVVKLVEQHLFGVEGGISNYEAEAASD